MKSYGQYCALAKTLDRIGDRWTLLVVRELLVRSCRYSELRAALPGIATNLLADRLRDLESDGIVRRNENGSYELTELGRGLDKAVHELVRWGAHWMGERSAAETFRPEWLVVALAALLPKRPRATIEIKVGGHVLGIERGRVRLGPVTAPDATVEGLPEAVLAVVAGKMPLRALTVTGNRAVVEATLAGTRKLPV